jgi:lipopolysaccharide transport system ATP-binding protein
LAVGDVDFQKKCLGKMQDVASNQGRTVLFVSHNMAAVESMCDCAILLERGSCITKGDTNRIVQDYLREMSRVATTPLEQRLDREGSGEIRFISMVSEGPGNSPVSAFRCGDEAILHFVMENRTGRNLQKVRIAFKIFDEGGYCVGQLDSWLLGQDAWEISPGRTSVRIVIPRMTLTPGRYRISAWAGLNGSDADWILDAGLFDVEEGDYYGTGRLPTTGRVAFLMDHQILTRTNY